MPDSKERPPQHDIAAGDAAAPIWSDKPRLCAKFARSSGGHSSTTIQDGIVKIISPRLEQAIVQIEPRTTSFRSGGRRWRSGPRHAAPRRGATSTTCGADENPDLWTPARRRGRRALGPTLVLYIVGDAVAEGPVFRPNLDQVDEDVLGPQPRVLCQAFDDAPV
jgi:hypothetical protein